jgi:hypothetical protein
MFVVGFCLMWLKWHDIDYSMTAQFAVNAGCWYIPEVPAALVYVRLLGQDRKTFARNEFFSF